MLYIIPVYHVHTCTSGFLGAQTMEKRITLKDIADHCGLAATTVSRILRDKSTYCSAAKIEMVKRIAKEWNYSPNIGYNIMAGRNTNIAAIIFSQPRGTQDDQSNRLYMHLMHLLDNKGFASYTAVMDYDLDSQMRKIRALDERGCRYYFFVGTPVNYECLFAFLDRMKRKYIGFDSLQSPRCIVPDRAGAYINYCDIIHRAGLKNICIAVTENYFENNIIPRIPPAEQENFRQHLLAVPPVRYIGNDINSHYFELGRMITCRALSEVPELDALAFTTDYHVFGAAAVLKERGLYGKIRLFGMRDASASQFAGIDFTTTRFDVRAGAEQMLEHIDSGDELKIIVPGQLIEYSSVKNDSHK